MCVHACLCVSDREREGVCVYAHLVCVSVYVRMHARVHGCLHVCECVCVHICVAVPIPKNYHAKSNPF